MTYTIKELRKELKEAGFKLKIVTHSDFKAGTIFHNDGTKLTSIMNREGFEKFKKATEIREKYKGKIFDGLYRVTI